MLYLPFQILILTALICWTLSRRIPTRLLGYLSALASLGALAATVYSSWRRSLPLFSETHTWAEAEAFSVILGLQLDGLNLLLALALLFSGVLYLAGLARSIPGDVRGYGALFAALLLVLAGGLLALLSVDLLLLVFGWGVVVLGSVIARRASGGADERSETAPIVQPGGFLLLAAVLLFGLTRGGGFTTSILAAAPVNGPVFGAWLAAAAAAMGLPLFSRPSGDGSPLQLQGLLLGCGLPLFAGYSLLRLYSMGSFGPQAWPALYYQLLMALGAAGVVCCSAAALQSSHLGSILGWQTSAQFGLMLLALGVGQSGAVVAAIALLVNIVMTTMVASLALSVLTDRSRSYNLGYQPKSGVPLPGAGIAYGLAAASAVGLPPLWGFWSRLWLVDSGSSYPWLLPLVALSSGLLGLSYLGPLSLFWRRGATAKAAEEAEQSRFHPSILLGAATLLLLSIVPSQVWRLWLKPAAVDTLPPGASVDLSLVLPSILFEAGLGTAAVLVLLLILLRSRREPESSFTGGEPFDADEGTPLVPVAIGYSLRALALLARPSPLHNALGRGLQGLSSGLNWALQIVGGRYYLTGIFMAMVILLILLIA